MSCKCEDTDTVKDDVALAWWRGGGRLADALISKKQKKDRLERESERETG
jgi:hypothetical protein